MTQIDQLQQLIIRSAMLNPARKEELLKQLPSLPQEQVSSLLDTFENADQQQHKQIVAVLKEKPELWDEISESIKAEQKGALTRREAEVSKNEEEELSSLESELNSIFN